MFYSAFVKLAILGAIFRIVSADDDDDDDDKKGNPCWKIPDRTRTWEFIPCEDGVNNADPVARVFKSRLYVYTSWDDKNACGKQWNAPSLKKEGAPSDKATSFCMQGT